MNTVRDNTRRVGIEIGRMSKGDLKAFHAAFLAADAGLDGKVCKGTGTTDCQASTGQHNLGKAYEAGGTEQVGNTDGPNIATSLSKLSKEEKAVLAAAFAKAVEGDAVWEEQE